MGRENVMKPGAQNFMEGLQQIVGTIAEQSATISRMRIESTRSAMQSEIQLLHQKWLNGIINGTTPIADLDQSFEEYQQGLMGLAEDLDYAPARGFVANDIKATMPQLYAQTANALNARNLDANQANASKKLYYIRSMPNLTAQERQTEYDKAFAEFAGPMSGGLSPSWVEGQRQVVYKEMHYARSYEAIFAMSPDEASETLLDPIKYRAKGITDDEVPNLTNALNNITTMQFNKAKAAIDALYATGPQFGQSYAIFKQARYEKQYVNELGEMVTPTEYSISESDRQALLLELGLDGTRLTDTMEQQLYAYMAAKNDGRRYAMWNNEVSTNLLDGKNLKGIQTRLLDKGEELVWQSDSASRYREALLERINSQLKAIALAEENGVDPKAIAGDMEEAVVAYLTPQFADSAPSFGETVGALLELKRRGGGAVAEAFKAAYNKVFDTFPMHTQKYVKQVAAFFDLQAAKDTKGEHIAKRAALLDEMEEFARTNPTDIELVKEVTSIRNQLMDEEFESMMGPAVTKGGPTILGEGKEAKEDRAIGAAIQKGEINPENPLYFENVEELRQEETKTITQGYGIKNAISALEDGVQVFMANGRKYQFDYTTDKITLYDITDKGKPVLVPTAERTEIMKIEERLRRIRTIKEWGHATGIVESEQTEEGLKKYTDLLVRDGLFTREEIDRLLSDRRQ